MTPAWLADTFEILIAIFLVLLNGFFVAAEFALVKVRLSQVEQLVAERQMFAKTAKWLAVRLDASLSACQLGITMASLGLGWVGEPAFAHLITPLLHRVGVTGEAMVHGIAFVIAFSMITALHLVIGEQAPKIFAIRRPETMILWCAAPLWFFYVILFPFLAVLNVTTLACASDCPVRAGVDPSPMKLARSTTPYRPPRRLTTPINHGRA